ALLGEGRQPGDEVHPVLVIPEDGAPLDPPHHDMVQGIGGIQPGATGHSGRSLAQSDESGNVPPPTSPTRPPSRRSENKEHRILPDTGLYLLVVVMPFIDRQ